MADPELADGDDTDGEEGLHRVLEPRRGCEVRHDDGVRDDHLGPNLAEDVTYSGTIAGAMEGTILGVPSFALSQAYGPTTALSDPYWGCAETHAPGLIKKLMGEARPPNTLININFPDCPAEDVQGVAVTTQGKRDAKLLKIEPRHDGRGQPYYWIAFERGSYTPGAGTDLEAVAAKKISVTPLRLDLTDAEAMTRACALLG